MVDGIVDNATCRVLPADAVYAVGRQNATLRSIVGRICGGSLPLPQRARANDCRVVDRIIAAAKLRGVPSYAIYVVVRYDATLLEVVCRVGTGLGPLPQASAA